MTVNKKTPDYKVTEEPKLGDYNAFRVDVWYEHTLMFTLIVKLTGTEIAVAIANKNVKNEIEALEKLKTFSLAEARNIYNAGNYKVGQTIRKFFSPSW